MLSRQYSIRFAALPTLNFVPISSLRGVSALFVSPQQSRAIYLPKGTEAGLPVRLESVERPEHAIQSAEDPQVLLQVLQAGFVEVLCLQTLVRWSIERERCGRRSPGLPSCDSDRS